MRKFSRLLLIGAVALGLAACNNEDVDTPNSEKGNTHVAVSLKMSMSPSGASPRSLPDDYNYVGEWAGKDKINSVDIYLVDGATVSANTFTVSKDNSGDYTQSTDGNSVVLKPNKAIRTTPGIKKVYVLINATDDVKKGLSMTEPGKFDQAYKAAALALANSGDKEEVSTSADKLAKKNGVKDETIVMTNVQEVSINVAPNVDEEATLTGTNPQNRGSVQVERAVARALVTTAKVVYDVPSKDGSLKLGTLKDITWVLAQGENSLYLQRKSDRATPNFAWNPGVGSDDFISQAGDKYDYSGLFEERANKQGGTDIPTLENYAEASALQQVSKELNDKLSGKFVLPNTHVFAAAPAGDDSYQGGYKKGNTVYVLIRGTFVPEIIADGGTLVDGTFYLGGIDGEFYSTAQAAYDAGNTSVAKYEKGKTLYYAWLNPDNVPGWYNSPVLRNNVYHVHISGISGIGTNWNPLYPEDPERVLTDPSKPFDPNTNPYLPKVNPDPKPVPEVVLVPDPANPDGPKVEKPSEEPENPIDPTDPLTTPETWMSVDVTVLPWLLHSYQVNLGI